MNGYRYVDAGKDPAGRTRVVTKALEETSAPVVVMPQFSSYFDPALFGQHVPGDPLVIIPPSVARRKLFSSHMTRFRFETVDAADPTSIKTIVKLIKENRCTVIFPELAPSSDGLPGRVSDAAAAAIASTEAVVIPARAVNSQYTMFSPASRRINCVAPPPVRLHFGERMSFAGMTREAARLAIERALRDVMAESEIQDCTLYDSLVDAGRKWGWHRTFSIEPDGSRLKRKDFLLRVELLAGVFDKMGAEGERIGIMLPNTAMTLASIIGMQHAGRIPAMINFSMGSRALLSCCAAVSATKIVSSRRFVSEGKFEPLVEAMEAGGVKFVYLEDLVAAVPKRDKLSAAAAAFIARTRSNRREDVDRGKVAIVLFTSGSEGAPKAVALTYANFQANIAQVRATLPFLSTDVMLAVLPMFHSYGLSTGVLMPIEAGMAIAFYPTPLHYKNIPHYASDVGATVLLGTNSFLAGYAKSADSFDFSVMKTVVCGGDKLRESTASLWRNKFGIRILEGYGVTECSPVVGVNRRGRYKFGSIGQCLPLIETSLKPVEGVEGAGRLVLRGPNIMAGYMQPDGSLVAPEDGAYDTGDICSIDDEGYITIEGRAKRFAKIGGEMISLAHIEEAAQEMWPDDALAVVSIADEAKGEQLVMLTERKDAVREELRVGLTSRGLPEIAVPKRVVYVEALPRIGVGKTDYTAAAKIAADSK